jgi:hypothetical protein
MRELSGILICEFEMHIRVNLHLATTDELRQLQSSIKKLLQCIDPTEDQTYILGQIKLLHTELRLL